MGGKREIQGRDNGPTKEELRKQKDEIEALIPMNVDKCKHIAGCRRIDKKAKRRQSKNTSNEMMAWIAFIEKTAKMSGTETRTETPNKQKTNANVNYPPANK